MKQNTDPVPAGNGYERHAAFGMISVHRISASPPVTLFQSDVGHSQLIRIAVHEAERKRSAGSDHVHSRRLVCEVSMSMAQFAAFVASGGTEGVPCTIEFTGSGDNLAGSRPGLNPETRFSLTHEEVRAAAEKAFNAIKEAEAAYVQAVEGRAPVKEQRRLLSVLHSAIANAAPNVAYAAKTLDEHAETVVNHARADIEAIATRIAEAHGISRDTLPAIEEGR